VAPLQTPEVTSITDEQLCYIAGFRRGPESGGAFAMTYFSQDRGVAKSRVTAVLGYKLIWLELNSSCSLKQDEGYKSKYGTIYDCSAVSHPRLARVRPLANPMHLQPRPVKSNNRRGLQVVQLNIHGNNGPSIQVRKSHPSRLWRHQTGTDQSKARSGRVVSRLI